MIYFFNASLRPVYRVNVLNTLFVPNGYLNTYRYSLEGQIRHVPPATFEALRKTKAGEPAVVVFIDRYAVGGYRFYPLRLGKFIRCRKEQEYLHVDVQLEQLISPLDSDRFNADLHAALGSLGLPQLTNHNPDATNDGNYVIIGGSVFALTAGFRYGEDAWPACVNALAQTQRFTSTAAEHVVFARAQVRPEYGKPSSVKVKAMGTSSALVLTRGGSYELVISYKYPIQNANHQARSHVDVAASESSANLRLPGQRRIMIDGVNNSVPIPLDVNRHAENARDGISFTWEPEAGQAHAIVAPDKSLNIVVKESPSAWIQIGLAVLLYAGLGALIGTDLPPTTPLSVRALWQAGWLKLVMGVVQAGALVWLVKILGQKIF